MTFENLIFLILFSATCGLIGQVATGQPYGNLLATLAVGFLGALLGSWLSSLLGVPALFTLYIGIFAFPILWSILGSILLMGVVSLFLRRQYIYY